MIKAILFDVGGVLYTDPGKQMHADIISELGVSPEAWYSVWSEVYEPFSKDELSEEKLWLIVKEKLHLTSTIPPDLFLKAHIKYLQPNKPMLDAVEVLRNKHITVGVLSNIYKPQADYNKAHALYKGFSPVVLSCDVGMKKPEKEIFFLALSQLGIPAEEVLFIDDKESNVVSAQNAGFVTAHYLGTLNVDEFFAPFGITLNV